MNAYPVILTIVVTISFAFSCWLVFWTESAVKFAQSQGGTNFASESWYPIWLRFEGIWLWVMIGFCLSVSLRS